MGVLCSLQPPSPLQTSCHSGSLSLCITAPSLLSISSDAESDPFLPVPMPDGIALCYTQSWRVLGREVLEVPRCWGKAFYKQEQSHWKPLGEESLIRGSWMTSCCCNSADADFTYRDKLSSYAPTHSSMAVVDSPSCVLQNRTGVTTEC